MGQLGRSGENKDVLNSLLSSQLDFLHTRHGPIIEKDSGFNSSNAGLFHLMTVFLKAEFVSEVQGVVRAMIQSDERAAQCSAVEVVAGILRAYDTFSAEEVLLSLIIS